MPWGQSPGQGHGDKLLRADNVSPIMFIQGLVYSCHASRVFSSLYWLFFFLLIIHTSWWFLNLFPSLHSCALDEFRCLVNVSGWQSIPWAPQRQRGQNWSFICLCSHVPHIVFPLCADCIISVVSQSTQPLKQTYGGNSLFLPFASYLHWMSDQMSTHLLPKYFLKSFPLFLCHIPLPGCGPSPLN